MSNRLRINKSGLLISIFLLFLAACTDNDNDNNNNTPTNSANAIYQGVEGYGISDNASDKDNFYFKFFANGQSESFKISNSDSTYALQNMLQEGERLKITWQEGTNVIQNIETQTPSAQGVVTSISSTQIQIGQQTVKLSDEVQFTLINHQAGGSVVSKLASVSVGDTVKVYGNPAKFVDKTFVAQSYNPPVKPVAGLRTIKNFLKTALSACGTTLYIYGGGWNWQDNGSSIETRTIGVPQAWIDFFQTKDANYKFRENDPTKTYYPWHSYNEYYYAGADCSGFVGWTIYNVMNTASGNPGYVMASTKMAYTLANKYGYGTFSKQVTKEDYLPGDITSIGGHVWICLGRASDGSLVVIHCTATQDDYGSGVQISPLNDKEDCVAKTLAQNYMKTYYPAWSARYQVLSKDYSIYTNFSKTTAGRFRWSISQAGLSDPDHYLSMPAEEILKDLFGEQ